MMGPKHSLRRRVVIKPQPGPCLVGVQSVEMLTTPSHMTAVSEQLCRSAQEVSREVGVALGFCFEAEAAARLSGERLLLRTKRGCRIEAELTVASRDERECRVSSTALVRGSRSVASACASMREPDQPEPAIIRACRRPT